MSAGDEMEIAWWIRTSKTSAYSGFMPPREQQTHETNIKGKNENIYTAEKYINSGNSRKLKEVKTPEI